MATILGNGLEYDYNCIAGTSVKTTTSQYLCVGEGPTTTAADQTVIVTDDSTTAGTYASYFAVGINQTRAMSSNSLQCKVRMLGVSKAICSASVPAFSFVAAYTGVSTTTRRGQIYAISDGVSVTTATVSVSSQLVVLGRALEDGSTNSVISVFVNPSLYDLQLTEA